MVPKTNKEALLGVDRLRMGLALLAAITLLAFWPGYRVLALTDTYQYGEGIALENQGYKSAYCVHTSLIRPGCGEGIRILLLAKRWVSAHIRWDMSRWGLPVYVEFDNANSPDRWQRVSVLCLHIIKKDDISLRSTTDNKNTVSAVNSQPPVVVFTEQP